MGTLFIPKSVKLARIAVASHAALEVSSSQVFVELVNWSTINTFHLYFKCLPKDFFFKNGWQNYEKYSFL